MKKLTGLAVDVLLLNAVPLTAGTHYVSLLSTNPISPYTNWATAAVTIQQAVDATVDGDQVLVTNGSYASGARALNGTSNRVAVTNSITLRSVNGPAVTAIIGAGPLGADAVRCVYLGSNAVLDGFTLTNGATQLMISYDQDYSTVVGGGVFCDSGVLTNCVLAGNSAWYYGGGAAGGTLNNCMLTGNTANSGGGASGAASDSTLNGCTLIGNLARGAGGGAEYSTLNNCTLTGNSCGVQGGGAYQSTLNN